MELVLKSIGGIILGLFVVYASSRLVAWGFLKSYEQWSKKHKTKEEENNG